MKANRQVIGPLLTLVLLQMPASAAGTAKPVCSPPGDLAMTTNTPTARLAVLAEMAQDMNTTNPESGSPS